MKNRVLLIVLVVLIIIYIFKGSFNNKTSFFNNEVNVITENGNISLEMEDYLIGVIAGEMPALFEEEALKAQAIASRSYAYNKINSGMSLTNTKSTQVYLTNEQMQEKWQEDYDKYYNKIKKAVNDTKDLVILYNDEVISAYYFSMSNGYTENAINVFGEDKNYLISVISVENTSNKNYEVTTVFNKEEFCQKLGINCDNIEINNIQKSITNRVDNITINNKVFKGTEIRKLLDLRSTDFEINITNDIEITTYGYGHGVGMSQYGANEMAKNGSNYEEIIKYYYTDVEIKNINSIKK